MKVNGASKAGGIFKLGKASSSDSFGGTYTFAGSHTLRFVNPTANYSEAIGSSSSLSGSITINGSAVTGSILEQNSNGSDTLQGELTGPRVTAKILTQESTIFIVFLVNESDVTGLYMEFNGQLDEPARDPLAAGTFSFTSMTKN